MCYGLFKWTFLIVFHHGPSWSRGRLIALSPRRSELIPGVVVPELLHVGGRRGGRCSWPAGFLGVMVHSQKKGGNPVNLHALPALASAHCLAPSCGPRGEESDAERQHGTLLKAVHDKERRSGSATVTGPCLQGNQSITGSQQCYSQTSFLEGESWELENVPDRPAGSVQKVPRTPSERREARAMTRTVLNDNPRHSIPRRRRNAGKVPVERLADLRSLLAQRSAARTTAPVQHYLQLIYVPQSCTWHRLTTRYWVLLRNTGLAHLYSGHTGMCISSFRRLCALGSCLNLGQCCQITGHFIDVFQELSYCSTTFPLHLVLRAISVESGTSASNPTQHAAGIPISICSAKPMASELRVGPPHVCDVGSRSSKLRNSVDFLRFGWKRPLVHNASSLESAAFLSSNLAGADSAAPRRNRRPASPSPLPGTMRSRPPDPPSGNPVNAVSGGTCWSQTSSRLLQFPICLATTQECSGETGWHLSPPRRITRVGEDSRWRPKTLYILPQPSGRESLMEAAWPNVRERSKLWTTTGDCRTTASEVFTYARLPHRGSKLDLRSAAIVDKCGLKIRQQIELRCSSLLPRRMGRSRKWRSIGAEVNPDDARAEGAGLADVVPASSPRVSEVFVEESTVVWDEENFLRPLAGTHTGDCPISIPADSPTANGGFTITQAHSPSNQPFTVKGLDLIPLPLKGKCEVHPVPRKLRKPVVGGTNSAAAMLPEGDARALATMHKRTLLATGAYHLHHVSAIVLNQLTSAISSGSPACPRPSLLDTRSRRLPFRCSLLLSLVLLSLRTQPLVNLSTPTPLSARSLASIFIVFPWPSRRINAPRVMLRERVRARDAAQHPGMMEGAGPSMGADVFPSTRTAALPASCPPPVIGTSFPAQPCYIALHTQLPCTSDGCICVSAELIVVFVDQNVEQIMEHVDHVEQIVEHVEEIKVIKQNAHLLVIVNMKENLIKQKHGILFPSDTCCAIRWPSSCGKTCVIISLLEHLNGLRFENIYMCKYQRLATILLLIEGILYFPFTNKEDIIPPDEALPNYIFILDNVCCESQGEIQQYCSFGRHSKVDCFYLAQSYACIPKHNLHDNANIIVLKCSI
ncbi:hypothetical protein PR048_019152 [Dryococelus australis]|uniref:Uncharacterized protein n=1 Tax=Dryococelus australis TaxID=614101 RepID=A0ABQ9H2T7_9NEOP|nr:hypothetical protein PR048_019152 [Dryococelus australis]